MRFSAIERSALRQWLSNALVMLCDDVDPLTLSDLAIACLSKDAPDTELRTDIVAELSHFLKDETVPFVGKLFDALASKSYMVQAETVDTEGVAVVSEKRANSRSPERRSGSRERSRGIESSRRRSRSRERPAGTAGGSSLSGGDKNASKNDRGKPARDASARGDRRVDDRRKNVEGDAWRSGVRLPGAGANSYPRPSGNDPYGGPYQWLGNGGYAGRQPAQYMPGISQPHYGYPPYGLPPGNAYSQPPGALPFSPRGMIFPAPPSQVFPALSPPGTMHHRPAWPPVQPPVAPTANVSLASPALADASGAPAGGIQSRASPQASLTGSAAPAAATPRPLPLGVPFSIVPGHQQDVPLSQKRTLRVSDIPVLLLNMASLAEHFGRFGVVSNLLVRPPVRGDSKSEAYVQFSDHQAATRAKMSPDPVCGNASISVSWARFDPMSPEGTPVDVLLDSDRRDWGDRRSGPSSSPPQGSATVRLDPSHGFRSVGALAPSVSAAPSLVPASPMVAAQQLLDKQREQSILVDSAIAKYKDMLLGLQSSRAGMDKAQLASALVDIKAQADAIKTAQARLSAAIATAQRAAQAAQEAEEKKAQASLTRQSNLLVVTAAETTALRIAPYSIGGATAAAAADDASKIDAADESDAVLVTGEDELTTTEADSASFADQATAAGVYSNGHGDEMYRGGGIEERSVYT
jgi:hypothetical protein